MRNEFYFKRLRAILKGLIEFRRGKKRFIVARFLEKFPDAWVNEQISILKQIRNKLGKRRLLG